MLGYVRTHIWVSIEGKRDTVGHSLRLVRVLSEASTYAEVERMFPIALANVNSTFHNNWN